MRLSTPVKQSPHTRAEGPDPARRGRRARRGRSGSGRLSDHGSDRYDRCSADIERRVALRGADMGYDVSDDKDAYTAVRAETHDQATRSRNVLPAFAGSVLHHHRRIAELHL